MKKGGNILKRFRGFAVGLAAGCMLMFTIPSLAQTVKSYTMVDASYPVYVNHTAYESPELPILNYDGHTYIPMRAVGDILGASVLR